MDVLSLHPSFPTFPPSWLAAWVGSGSAGWAHPTPQHWLLRGRRGGWFALSSFPAAVATEGVQTVPRPEKERRYQELLTSSRTSAQSSRAAGGTARLRPAWLPAHLLLQRSGLSPAFPLSQALGSPTVLQRCER